MEKPTSRGRAALLAANSDLSARKGIFEKMARRRHQEPSLEKHGDWRTLPNDIQLVSVREAAAVLGVSERWVRRHAAELPVVHVGRLIRFDSSLLLQKFRAIHPVGKPLTGKVEMPLQVQRYQRGSVFKRYKKVWYGMWRKDVLDAEGNLKRQQRKVRLGTTDELPTRSAAYDKLMTLMGPISKPSVDMKFSELVQRWQTAIYPTLRDTSGNNYLYNVQAYVEPIFKDVDIRKITRFEVQTFLNSKAGKFCRNSIKGMRAAFSRVMTFAVEMKWISDNPCLRVALPQAPSRVKRTVLKPKQIKAISAELREPYATLCLFLPIMGPRIGETVALKWSDFEDNVVHITRKLYNGRIGPTKRKKSERALPVPQMLMARLKQMRELLTPLQRQSEWVFPSRTGTPLDDGNALRRHVRPAAEKLGIAIGGWHDFRHTVATKLLRYGESPKVVSDILGNSVDVLLKVYDHPEIDDFRKPLNEVAGELLPNVTYPASGD
jgi:integrase